MEFVVEGFMTLIVLVAAWLFNSGELAAGRIIGLIGNVLWVLMGLHLGSNSLVALNVIMGIVYLRGIIINTKERNYV